MNTTTTQPPKLPPAWFKHAFWRVHRALNRLSGGRFLWTPADQRGWGALRLTTTGRKSGQDRSVIVGYIEDGANLVTLAMNGWDRGHPAWWLNLKAHPEAVVQLARRQPHAIRAREALGQERARLWQRWADIDADLDSYARSRTTTTPVVVFEPRPHEDPDTDSYRRVLVTRRGGPDALEVAEQELREPGQTEVRVRVRAASVSQVDVQARYGRGPFRQRPPFVPGYAVVGVVDALGDAVTGLAVGDRVGVLTETGGYSEYVYVRRHPLVRVPASVDAAQAVVLMLNYLVAYQVLHRQANVRAGDRVLIIGAGGGIGTALCDLGRLAGLRMYGVEAAAKHPALLEYGVTPIDWSTQHVEEVVRQAEPQGVDAVFDAVGGSYVNTGLAVLRPGGTLVEFANPGSKGALLRLLTRGVMVRLTGEGRTIKSYGTNVWRYGRGPFLHDWRVLFELLAEDRISPRVAATFPLLDAASANALLEQHGVTGTVVLLDEVEPAGRRT